MPNLDLLLRRIRLPDDEALRRRYPNLLSYSALRSAYETVVPGEDLPERPGDSVYTTGHSRILLDSSPFLKQINKQTEKMYVLLSVCLVLHPQRIDESLQAVLREKPHAERIMRMQKGELQVTS